MYRFFRLHELRTEAIGTGAPGTHFGRKVLMVLFGLEEAGGRFDARAQPFTISSLHANHDLFAYFLLLFGQVPYRRAILTFALPRRRMHPTPFDHQVLVRAEFWIVFHKQGLRVVHDVAIGRIVFDSARVAHETAHNAMDA
jgi:hypothetical protein